MKKIAFQIYQAIETGEADGGAIPIENSTAGSIEAKRKPLKSWLPFANMTFNKKRRLYRVCVFSYSFNF